MVTITGGKLTTWRRMAKMTVDAIVEREARDAPCRTHEIPLGQAVEPEELPRVEGVRDDAYAMLAGRYGQHAHDVLAVAAERGELAQPIVPDGPPDLLAEAVHAARHEQARSVGDALLRRTRLGLLAARAVARRGGRAAGREAMAPELGWDDERRREQARAFSTRRPPRASPPAAGRRLTSVHPPPVRSHHSSQRIETEDDAPRLRRCICLPRWPRRPRRRSGPGPSSGRAGRRAVS